MAQPCLNGQKIYTGLQQYHRECVSEDMRRDRFARESGRTSHGHVDSPPYNMGCSEAGQSCRVRAHKERGRLTRLDSAFVHQCPQRFGQILGYRYDPFLMSLPTQEHLRMSVIEPKIASIDAERLRYPRSGACEKQQQCPIPAAARDLLVWRVNEGVELGSRKIVRHFGVRLLDGNGENTLRDGERCGIVCCDVMEKRANCR